MAFAGSIAPRRKTTTYGKHSRRLISTLSSATETEFAQDAGATISGSEGLNGHLQGYGGNKSSKLLPGHSGTEQETDLLACQEPYPRAMIRDQLRSSPDRSDSTHDDVYYDIPLSDDEPVHNATAARKRRKILPNKMVSVKGSPTHDDHSLQRHVAAKARRGEGHILQSPRTTSAAQDADPRPWAVRHQVAAGKGRSKRMRETSKDSTPHNEIDANAVEQVEDPSVFREQPKAPFRAKVTSHRMQNTEKNPAKTTLRPTTPDTVFDSVHPQKPVSDARSPITSSESVHQRTTPSRSTSATGGATTPRQRELWHKLLVNDVPISCPSSLDFPTLITCEQRPEHYGGRAKSRRVSRGTRQHPTTLNARSKKIVDMLHQSDPDRDHFSGDIDEILGSSSSDNKSEDLHSEPSAAEGADTVQTSPSAGSQGPISHVQDQSSNACQDVPSLHEGCLKVTYARQRSYLTENDLEEAAMIGLPPPPESKNNKGYGRRRLEDLSTRTQLTKPVSEDSGGIPDSQGGTMRSIHELREAGGNVRLVSELEAILDDIGDFQSGSTSLRRSKLMQLFTKLEEAATCRRFVDQGLEGRLIANVGIYNDLISNGLLVAVLLQLMACSSSTLLLTQVGDVRVVSFLIELLGSDQDLLSCARLRGNNMSKAALADLKIVCSALMRSTAWRAGRPSVLSCHVMSLRCLEYIVRQMRGAGPLSEVLSAHAIRRIVVTSVPPFSTMPPQPGEISVVSLELAVYILESCTINSGAECQASLWAGETLKRVIGLLPLLSLWKREDCGSSRTLTLRLYLNLTNNSPVLCEDFSTPEIISVTFGIVISHFEQLAGSTPDIDKSLLLDDLILTLGFLINLADLSAIARQLVMNLDCGDESCLDTLLELFINRSKNAAEVRISSAVAQ